MITQGSTAVEIAAQLGVTSPPSNGWPETCSFCREVRRRRIDVHIPLGSVKRYGRLERLVQHRDCSRPRVGRRPAGRATKRDRRCAHEACLALQGIAQSGGSTQRAADPDLRERTAAKPARGSEGPDFYWARSIWIIYNILLRYSPMDNDFDPQAQAEAAMNQAVQADGFERQRWIRVAQAWLELTRARPNEASRPSKKQTA